VLVYAKLGSAAATVLIAFVIVTLFSAATWGVFAILGLGMEASDVAPEFMGQCAIAFLVVAATWVAYTRGGFVVMTCIILGLFRWFLREFFPEVSTYLWEMTALTLPLALKLTLLVCSLLLCWPFVRAYRRGVLSRRAVWIQPP
jgi:hypothetical protein